MSTESLKDTIAPKSDQLNADDLLTGPMTVQITSVSRGNSEQPVVIGISGGYQPFKPCKSMRRVMISIWGDNGAEWIGQSMTLFCDPDVKFGGVKVGGIRISHMSGIQNPVSMMLTTTRSKRAEYTVRPIEDGYAEYQEEVLPMLREAAMGGTSALEEAFKNLPKTTSKAKLWEIHGESLKQGASKAESAQ